jgi:Predicted membrane protein (DUF2157)
MEPTTSAPPPDRKSILDLAERLDVWVSEGVIDRADADAIAAFESGKQAPARGGRVTPVAEALAYLGGALAVAAAATALGGEWSELSSAARIVLVGAVWVASFVAGWRVHDPSAPSLVRLSRVLWLVSALALAWAAQLVVDEGFGFDGDRGFEASGLAMTVYAAALYLRRPNTLQQLALVVGLVLLLVAFTGESTLTGFAFWLLGIAWIVLGWRRVLVDPRAAATIGSLLVVLGVLRVASLEEELGVWLAVLSSAGLIAAGVGLRHTSVMVIGAIALFFSTFGTIQQYVEGSTGIALGLLVAGALVLSVAFVVRRLGRRPGTSPASAS